MCRVSNDRHSSDVRLLYRSPEGAGGGPAGAFFFTTPGTPITANDPYNNEQEMMRTVDAWWDEPPPLIEEMAGEGWEGSTRRIFANDDVEPRGAAASVSRLRDATNARLRSLVREASLFYRETMDLHRVAYYYPMPLPLPRETMAPEDFLEPDLYPDPMDDPERHIQRLREQEQQLQQGRRVQRQWAQNEQRRTRNDLNQQQRRRQRNFNREPHRRAWNQRR